MSSGKVLVVGGRGYFGRLLIDDLLLHTDCDLTVASRSKFHSDRFKTVIADLRDAASLERVLDDVGIAVCAAGPYQNLPSTLVELCLSRGIHYIDLSDDRGFVQKVHRLAENHEGSLSAICTGWSTVPALSGLLVGIASAGMTNLDSIQIQMAPGNRGARHTATVASLLYSVGQPFTVYRDGKLRNVVGWSEPREFAFPLPIGLRRGYLIDVPDHEIFPILFGARTVEFRAGSELQVLNACISLLSRTRRNWVSWSPLLQRAMAFFSWMGHDWGAIGVQVSSDTTRRASILAESRAERIAVMPAALMTAAFFSGVTRPGIYPYNSWQTRDQLQMECERRGFRLVVEGS
jgi:Saccharopine dehydrogenase NADP binding domain